MTSRQKSERGPSVETARRRVAQAIDDGFNEKRPVLIEALPSIGKSRGIIEWAAETGNSLTVFTARHELFDQYAGWCENRGLHHRKLPSFHNDCETANGKYGDDWAEKIKTRYRNSGLLPGELHKQAKELFGESLPCQHEGDCSYFTARAFDPAKYDVLIGHYRHAHVPERVRGRYVAFDEFPEGEFLSKYPPGMVSKAVSTYLDRHHNLPFSYLKDLKQSRRNPQRKLEGIEWFNRQNPDLKRDVIGAVDHASGNGHSEAPVMTYVILVAEDLENRWEFSQLPDGRTAVINPKDESLTILNPPALSGAKSVVALDGTPTVEKWRLMLGDDLLHHPILSDKEKTSYLRDTLGIRVIQTTDASNHYSGRSGISVTPELDSVLFEAVGNRENSKPALITSQSAKRKYEEHGLSELIQDTEHYGNLKGSNKFGTTRVGIVAGSTHYGDDYIKKWAALDGRSISRVESTKGMDQDFGAYGNRILHGMREKEVLQAMMRFGRDAGGATVYVHTAALPEWVERDEYVEEIRLWADGMKEVLDAISSVWKSEWRTKHIAEQVSVSSQQVRDHLHSLTDFGYISCRNEGRGYMWSDRNIKNISKRGHVQFTHKTGTLQA